MIGYILPDVGPQGAAADKRMVRLHSAGPWQYQMSTSPAGALATWRAAGPVPISAFGPQRPTTDGMIYLPPKVLPDADALLRPHMRERVDLADVMVNQDTGLTLRILPAQRTPRQIMEDNTIGDHVTAYARAVHALLDKYKEKKGDYLEDLAEVCRLAITYTYRVTRELLADLGWLNEESLLPLWRAALSFPKTEQPNASAASA